MARRIKQAADLFCGAGGTSTGMLRAAERLNQQLQLLAINHWPTAVQTHSLNHSNVRHLCESLENISPSRVIRQRYLDLLAASPECTHHSNAAGGRPRNEQSRATAWHVCRWLADLRVENLLIENVAEFQNWGPLNDRGKVLKRRKGEYFKAFLNAIANMGYHVEYRVLNAADFGDPTSRRRLYILARRGKPITWPEPTHGPGRAQPYRTARQIIDWSLKGESIFRRKKPLSENTLKRIAAGLKKFGGPNAAPFLVMLYGTGAGRSVDRPTPTVTANGNHIGLAQPFIVGAGGPTGAGRPQSVDQPMGTVMAHDRHAVVQPFITHCTHHGADRIHSVDDPVPTVTGAHRGEMALVNPFILPHRTFENMSTDSVDKPLRTITASGGRMFGLAEPVLVKIDQHGSNGCCAHAVDAPAPTIMTKAHIGLAQPFIVKYYGTGRAVTVDQPLDTVTTKDRFMLVEPQTGKVVAELDILFRMLQPHELAAAMSFPTDYKFAGTREEQVKQIGNAVAVEQAAALATSLLS